MPISGGRGSPTPPNKPPSGEPNDADAGITDATARRLALALDLLRRQLLLGASGAFSFHNRDTTAAPAAAGGASPAPRGPAPAPTGGTNDAPKPVVVIGWRAGTINVNVAGGKRAAEVLDLTNQREDASRRIGFGDQEWSKKWDQLRDPQKEAKAKDKTWQELFQERQNAAKKEPKAGGWSGLGGSAGGQLLRMFAPVIGPMMALSAVLGSANSGMSAFQKSVNIMGATLAPILLPGIVLLSAVILSLSDIIWSKVKPNIATMASVITTIAPAVEAAVGALADLVDAIAWVVEVTKNPSKLLTGTDAEKADAKRRGEANPGAAQLRTSSVLTDIAAANFNPFKFMANRMSGSDMTSRVDAARQGAEDVRRHNAAAGNTPPADGPVRPGDRLRQQAAESRRAREAADAAPTRANQPGGRVMGNVKKIAQDLAMSMGPSASFGSIAGASKAATMASLNKSPLDAELLMRNLESIQGLLSGIEGNTEERPAPRYQGDRPGGG